MKHGLLIVTACALAAVLTLAAQDRGPDSREFGGQRPMGGLAAALDTDRDGAISAAELRAASVSLKTLDRNGDGQLTPEELRPEFGPGGFRGRGGRGDEGEGRGGAAASSPDELADTLMAFDRNNDGRLARDEVPERFQGLFDRADGNKDGALTRDELKESATAAAQSSGGRREGGPGRGPGGRGGGDPLLRALDRDADGVVSEAEIARSPETLAALDANHDGQLTADEFRMQGRGRGGRHD